jgi:hypothetical protein
MISKVCSAIHRKIHRQASVASVEGSEGIDQILEKYREVERVG